MAEYSRMAKGSFTAASGQTSAVITLPFQPDFVEVWNLTNIGNAALAGNILRAYWDNNIPPFTPSGLSASSTMVEVYNATPAVIYDTVYTNGVTGGTSPAGGISSFYGGLALQYGPTIQIASTTKATNTITTATAHGYSVGDTVIMQGLATGVTNNAYRLLNGIPFTIVTVPTSTTFTISWNTNQSNYTALSASPAGALVKKVLYPFLYLPEDDVVSAVTTGATQTVIQTTMYHNLELGQEVAFRVPSFWGMTQLNSLPNNVIPGSPIYGYVTAITGTVNGVTLDNWHVAVNINSTGYTAFNTNQSTIPTNITPAQIVPVGDVNTGGVSIGTYDTTTLYPSPAFPIPNNRVPTINGPAVKGSFVNNTSQGFIIGNGTPQQQAGTGTIVTSGAEILWHAYLHDYARP
jgi:hypothetical protein